MQGKETKKLKNRAIQSILFYQFKLLVYGFVLALFFSACFQVERLAKPQELTPKLVKKQAKSQKPKLSIKKQKYIDKFQVPQNNFLFVRQIPRNLLGYRKAYNSNKAFMNNYFKPWNIRSMTETQEQIQWAFAFYSKNSYTYNKAMLSYKFFDHLKNNARFKAYNSVARKAVAVRNTDLQSFPSKELFFSKNPVYPFDRNQITTIKTNTPLFISHFSKDKHFAYIKSPCCIGWIDSRSLAFVSNRLAAKLQKMDYAVIIEDEISILDSQKNFLYKAKTGTLVPIMKEENAFFKAFAIVHNHNRQAVLKKIKISTRVIQRHPLRFNKFNAYRVSNSLLGELYGWGGANLHRDCSLMTKDFFAPFGILIPKHSLAQSKIGKVIDLKNKSDEVKKRLIKKYAVPYMTLLYLRGHIMLYIGILNGEPVALHNLWAIRYKQSGEVLKHVIGKGSTF